MDSPWVWSLLCSYLMAVLCETTQGLTVEAPSKTPKLGDSVTVRCVGSHTDMDKMSLYKDDRLVTEDVSHQIRRTNTRVELTISSVSAADYGLYTCRSNDIIYGHRELSGRRWSRSIWIWAPRTIIPDQGSVDLECSVEDFENRQWLRRSSRHASDFEILNENKNTISVTRGGVYSCRGVDTLIITKESKVIDIWETGRPLLMPSWAFIRDTVILQCEGPSNKTLHFYKDGVIVKSDTNHQFKRTSETTVELMIVSASGSDQGGYSCGTDGETLYRTKELRIYTDRSWSIRLSADSLLIPEGGRVMLSCEIESFQKYQWIRRTSAHTSDFEILNEATAKVSVHRGGVYSCRGKEELLLTPESDTVTIWETDAVILLIPALPVPEGHGVSLTCKPGHSAPFSFVLFYKDEQLMQNGSSRQYNISAVSESDQGSYRCELHDSAQNVLTSPESWLCVKLTREKSFPVFAVMRLVAGMIVLLILLLILWHFCNTEDLFFVRSKETRRTCAEDHVTSAPEDPFTRSQPELQIIYKRSTNQEDVCVFSPVLTPSAAEGH